MADEQNTGPRTEEELRNAWVFSMRNFVEAAAPDTTVKVTVEMLRWLRGQIVEVLCSQALSDNFGDIRDAERHLWALLGVDYREVQEHTDDMVNDVFAGVRGTLAAHAIPLPEHLRREED